MRKLSLAFVAALPLISIPAAAQQTGATSQAGVDQNVQTEADKGIKTRNSGESGYVANQDKRGAASHAPGETTSTAGMTTGSRTPNDQSKINSSSVVLRNLHALFSEQSRCAIFPRGAVL
ncbi:hypothetical protein [Bradyrhizobium sp. RT6a]|uniref:hypothetical protein n=1 Tax=unclassified Bradyrhizobium TaxID=2631580 RepID=UPI00339AEEE4